MLSEFRLLIQGFGFSQGPSQKCKKQSWVVQEKSPGKGELNLQRDKKTYSDIQEWKTKN
jgi:hypothetical protein